MGLTYRRGNERAQSTYRTLRELPLIGCTDIVAGHGWKTFACPQRTLHIRTVAFRQGLIVVKSCAISLHCDCGKVLSRGPCLQGVFGLVFGSLDVFPDPGRGHPRHLDYYEATMRKNRLVSQGVSHGGQLGFLRKTSP